MPPWSSSRRPGCAMQAAGYMGMRTRTQYMASIYTVIYTVHILIYTSVGTECAKLYIACAGNAAVELLKKIRMCDGRSIHWHADKDAVYMKHP